MGRVAMRGALATHLGHRPGTPLKGPCGAVVARTAVAPRLSPRSRHPRQRTCEEPRWLRPEAGLPGQEAGSRSQGPADCCGARA